ncbi:MAG TPA: di-heme enzyme [Candidatus Bathyarchaeia archaeon]|nr:di-heme enzyme [Candidatus Bathyarchaeia archaeon]
MPADNPMSEARILLGRHLFYDPRLSAGQTMACATCHQQARAFTDGRARPTGVTGAVHPRNAMSLTNVAYLPVLTWANPLVTSLEQQALLPIFGETPVEMGMAGREGELFARLAAEPRYPPLFQAAFPERGGAITLETITRALAAFERSLISARSPYDRYRYGGESSAISESARRGESLFFSERLECFHCHGGFNFTDSLVHARKPLAEFSFHNTGLYNIDGRGAYPHDGTGLMEHTGRPEDMGRFRTASLRNVALTAPYMHDGSVATLREAIAHYAAGGRTISSGPHAGDGSRSPLRSPFLPGFRLAEEEIADLVAFLDSLTDLEFVQDPRHADPWPSSSGTDTPTGGNR